jgi:chemotaxis protein MotB
MAGRGKKHGGHENHERWLVSYADFITLLFAFFVVMFASSQADRGKAAQVSQSVKGALEGDHLGQLVAEILGGAIDVKGKGNAQLQGPGGVNKENKPQPPLPQQQPDPNAEMKEKLVELAPSARYLNRELEADIKAGKIQVSLEPRGLVVSLKESAYFPSGNDAVAPETYDSLEKVAVAIKKLPNPVRLEGHTDSVPIHTPRFRSNWDLSAARAIAVMELFTDRLGVPRDRMAIAGYADTSPVSSNDTADGRARNRRVDVVILNQYGLKTEPGQARAAAAATAAAGAQPAPAGEHKPKPGSH